MGSIRHHKGQRRALVVGISHTPELEEDERLAQRFPRSPVRRRTWPSSATR
ncbi:hypothetical protein WKI71_11845 [Streptomyces sp. MS1.AVA.1]|uniref:Uncharacterized protein n=1 Tax=Streptomyces machairae TaxID=3134109 RepID=A0ABU8UJ32_9ACTN